MVKFCKAQSIGCEKVKPSKSDFRQNRLNWIFVKNERIVDGTVLIVGGISNFSDRHSCSSNIVTKLRFVSEFRFSVYVRKATGIVRIIRNTRYFAGFLVYIYWTKLSSQFANEVNQFTSAIESVVFCKLSPHNPTGYQAQCLSKCKRQVLVKLSDLKVKTL